MTNYYGWTLNSSDYINVFGIDKGLTGIIIAATPFFAGLATVFFNYSTKYGFKKPHLLGFILMIISNILYFFAFKVNSLILLIFARIIFGIASIRIIT